MIDIGAGRRPNLRWRDGLTARPRFAVAVDVESGVLAAARFERQLCPESVISLLEELLTALGRQPLGVVLGPSANAPNVLNFLASHEIRVFTSDVYDAEEGERISRSLDEIEGHFVAELRALGVREL